MLARILNNKASFLCFITMLRKKMIKIGPIYLLGSNFFTFYISIRAAMRRSRFSGLGKRSRVATTCEKGGREVQTGKISELTGRSK